MLDTQRPQMSGCAATVPISPRCCQQRTHLGLSVGTAVTRMAAADGRAGLFENARVVGLEGAGHWLHHDRLDEFLRILREFLTAVRAAAAGEANL